MEAINALFQGIVRYDKLLVYAEQLQVTGELDSIYQQIVSALEQNYGIGEEEAHSILEYDKVTYTKKLDSIINGTEFVDPNIPVAEEETLEDMLPEEEALLNMSVIGGDDADREAAEEETTQMGEDEESIQQDTENSSEDSTSNENKELYSGSVKDSAVNFSK